MVFLPGCDDAQEHRDREEFRRQEEEKAAFKAKQEADREVVDAQGEAEIAYYEDEEEEEAPMVEIFKIGSDLAVENGGKNASVELDADVYAAEIWTYHYNYGSGAPAGSIEMVAEDGTVYGPWDATVNNSYYWVAYPSQKIPAGKYTVVDSDPGTWSQNGESGGQGMTWMMGRY